MRSLLLCLALACAARSFAQADSANVPFSENGWYLSPHGTIRILVLFAEIEYDVHPEKDPQPNGSAHWPKGQLPTWKDDVFDPQPLAQPKAMVTRYYHDVSMGDFVVLGDRIDRILTIRESEQKNMSNWSAMAVAEANKLGALHTAHGLAIDDFDLWKEVGRVGYPKEPGPDTPHSYDHVMTILRNSALTHGQGSTDPGSSGKLYGFDSDSQSRFGAMNALPFEILKHEFNHLLLGGNNFHSGGGNASQFQSYFINLQGGWSLMGAASSSLLTCSGWDRDRLGWRAPNARYRINARDHDGHGVNGDLDPVAGDTGLFVLRDFVTSGDALRIRLPYLADDELPEWIWVENHQTLARNGSPTDRFHWEADNASCIEPARPGLYMQVQVDREERAGKNVFGGDADYLHPLTASGHFDVYLGDDTLNDKCPFGGQVISYVQRSDLQNPLTGNCEQELPVYDRNGDGLLERKEHYIPNMARRDDGLHNNAIFFGRTAHAFTLAGNPVLGMGTNPSSANVLTLVSTGTKSRYKGGKPDVRTIHLNGVSVRIVAERPDGSIEVRVRNNDTYIDRDLRWCADSIVLHAIEGHRGYALFLAPGRRILLDRSRTPTRLDRPESVGAITYFSDPTRLTVLPGARMHLAAKAKLELENGSELHLLPGSTLELAPKAALRLAAGSRIVVHGDARVQAATKQVKKWRKKGRLVLQPQ